MNSVEHWWGGRVADGHRSPFEPGSSIDLEVHNRNQAAPILVSDRGNVVFSRSPFDFTVNEGRIDTNEQEREWLLAVEVLPSYTDEKLSSQVIDARHRFAKKRYDNAYKWTPTPEIETAIRNAIFDKSQR